MARAVRAHWRCHMGGTLWFQQPVQNGGHGHHSTAGRAGVPQAPPHLLQVRRTVKLLARPHSGRSLRRCTNALLVNTTLTLLRNSAEMSMATTSRPLATSNAHSTAAMATTLTKLLAQEAITKTGTAGLRVDVCWKVVVGGATRCEQWSPLKVKAAAVRIAAVVSGCVISLVSLALSCSDVY